MTLSRKVLLIVALSFAGVVGILYTVTSNIVLGSFTRLEEQRVHTNVTRVLNALQDNLVRLESTAGDWAPWDETRNFVQGKNKKYIDDNLVDATLTNLKINFMIFINSADQLVYAKGVDLGQGTDQPVAEDLIKHILTHNQLLHHQNPKDSKKGIILLPEKSVLLGAWPISDNNYKEPINGTLLVGRYFDDQEIQALKEKTQLSISFTRAVASGSAATTDAIQPNRFKKSSITSQVLNEDTIAGYTQVEDIYGNPALSLKVKMVRDVFQHGKNSIRYFLLIFFAVGTILLFVLLATLQMTVLGPIVKFTRHILKIKETGNLDSHFTLRRRDEIGTLAAEFNRMLAQVSEARNKLLEQSYYSGLAEMASGILHNTRNILTPMVGQISALQEKINGTPIGNLNRAMDELEGEDLDPEREHSLNRYLRLGSKQMVSLVQETDHQLKKVSDHVIQIEDILAEQDKYSHSEGAIEPLQLNKILKKASALMPPQYQNAVSLEIDAGVSQLPTVAAERVVLTQVVTNLLNNAAESVLRADKPQGHIHINGEVEKENDTEMVHLKVLDDGAGIDADSLNHIFDRGFSNKKSKTSGFGLHWCGNVLTSIQGRLYAESTGVGQGACLHLLIPANSN